jgi:hypothetical protein
MAKNFGGWRCKEHIGRGGNGDVYLAVRESDGEQGALKVLKRSPRAKGADDYDPTFHARFPAELTAMRKCADIPGVMPVLAAVDFRDDVPIERPWLVMPIAVPMLERLVDDVPLEEKVRAIHEIAEVLAKMHSRDVCHRDIKPENLFWLMDRWWVGDFGLVHYEGKEELTREGKKVGPTFYIANEALNEVGKLKLDWKKADVFSLAKTLWKLATNLPYPVPGSYYSFVEAHWIRSYNPHHLRAHLLDPIIFMATDLDPNNRPSMQEFADALDRWQQPPPKVVQPGALDIGDFDAQLSAMKAHAEARDKLAKEREAHRLGIDDRWRGPIRGFLAEIQGRLSGLSFEDVRASHIKEFGDVDGTIYVMHRLPFANSRATFEIGVSVQNHEAPHCWLDACVWYQIQLDRDVNQGTYFQERFDFIEGTADEERAFAAMREAIDKGLQDWVRNFAALVTPYGSAER